VEKKMTIVQVVKVGKREVLKARNKFPLKAIYIRHL
jgi:hypothetical protein